MQKHSYKGYPLSLQLMQNVNFLSMIDSGTVNNNILGQRCPTGLAEGPLRLPDIVSGAGRKIDLIYISNLTKFM